MSIVTYKRGDKTALTKNFTRDEFECQCKKCDAQMIDLELVDKLQSIRDVLGVKLKVTSGYRCITHNAKVHGSSHSKHLYGFAADWPTLDRVVNPVALGIIAQAVGFGGIGIFAIPEMGRFYRHVLIQKRYPHHGAVAFGHYGKTLFEVLKFFGIADIAYNQPKSLPYPTENPFA